MYVLIHRLCFYGSWSVLRISHLCQVQPYEEIFCLWQLLYYRVRPNSAICAHFGHTWKNFGEMSTFYHSMASSFGSVRYTEIDFAGTNKFCQSTLLRKKKSFYKRPATQQITLKSSWYCFLKEYWAFFPLSLKRSCVLFVPPLMC